MKFSIVTPSYNQGPFLERTINSVLAQDYNDIEYLIIDGGSTDHSVSIIKQHASNIHYWVSESDRGQAHAVNKGLKRATGDVIGWLNSDDIYYPGAISAVAEHFQTYPNCLFVYGKADYIGPDDKLIGPYRTRPWNYSALTRICYICQPSVFFRRSALERFGLLDESLQFCMDYEYWLRCGKESPFMWIERTLSASRLYPENKTLSSRPKILEEAANMLSKQLGYVPRRWLGEYALELAQNVIDTQDKGRQSLRQSLLAIKKWHQLQWRFNRGFLPLYPLQMLALMPLLPDRFRRTLRRLKR